MASVIFSSAQRIIAQVLEWLQTSNQGQTTNLITDTFSSGIDNSTSSGEGFLVVPGTNNTTPNPSVNVTLGGIAYDPTGARIFISPSDTTLYNPANVTATTNDGLGHFLSTPQSTGVINVPVTQSSSNYIWINYLATIDPTAFTLNAETNAKIFYKQTDGYNIQVTTTNVPPNADSIFLASVTTTGTAVASSNISQVGRTYYRINPAVVPITTPFNNGSNRTPSYTQNTTYTLDAHIKAVGTGTGISPFNPHNMSLADLGVGILDTVQEHRLLEHGGGGSSSIAANAIIAGVPGTPYPTLSAMAPSINIVNPGSDTINIFALSSMEFAIVNGSAFNASNIFGIATNATVMFPNASGLYDVYWDSNAKTFAVTTSDISTDITKIWLATVTYTFVGTGPTDHNALSGLLDRRRVGSTTHLLQRWTANSQPGAGSSLQPQTGEFGFNTTLGTMEFWNGSSWQQPVTGTLNGAVPTGTILEFAGSSAPTGFLMADGSSHSTATFPGLFAVIGYTYGGAGASFNVPNKINFVGVGAGGSIAPTLGSTAGATTQTPTENPHQHKENIVADSGAGRGVNDVAEFGTAPESGARLVGTFSAVVSETAASIYLTSADAATINPVSVVQPSIGLNYIIKT